MATESANLSGRSEELVADNDNKTLVLGKKAFVSTLIAIALNPVGIAVGYGVGKWLQSPRLSVPTFIVDAQTEGVALPKDLVPIVERLDSGALKGGSDTLRKGDLSAETARTVIAEAEESRAFLSSYKQDVESNIATTLKWTRGKELIVRPLTFAGGSLTAEAPQTIVNRDRNELLGIYRSTLKDVESRIEELERLLKYLDDHPPSDKRTGEAIIKVGVLNSGDSEGVLYPKGILRCLIGEVDLIATDNPALVRVLAEEVMSWSPRAHFEKALLR
jgi:hypothetical protein